MRQQSQPVCAVGGLFFPSVPQDPPPSQVDWVGASFLKLTGAGSVGLDGASLLASVLVSLYSRPVLGHAHSQVDGQQYVLGQPLCVACACVNCSPPPTLYIIEKLAWCPHWT
jgi:hypothetical protein